MTQPSSSTPQVRAAGVAFIMVTLLLDTLGVGLIIPILPRYLANLVGGDLGDASRFYGTLVAVYAAMQFVFAPVLGALSDRFGRRPVIFLSLLGAGLNYVLTAYAPSLGWLFVGRVIAGASAASFSAATAYIADVTPPHLRAQRFGLVGAAFGVGFILGPAFGGWLGGFSLRAPFLVAAGLNLANLAYGIFVLPESLKVENRRPFSFARANPIGALFVLVRKPVLLGLTGTIICAFLAQWILQTVWALHMQSRFSWAPLDVGLSLAVVGVASALVQGGLVRIVMPKLGERRAVLIGLLISASGFVGFGLASKPWMIYVLLLPFALGGIAGPAIQALLSKEVGPNEQGELQGSLASLQSVCAIVGPLIGAQLFSRFATEAASPRIPGAAFFAAACFNALGFALAALLFARLARRARVAELAVAKPEVRD